jgi:hypothetical protein
LPQPAVPADLEARLLAAIPAARSMPSRRWAIWVVALAAACVLIALVWRGRDGGRGTVPNDPTSSSDRQVTPRLPERRDRRPDADREPDLVTMPAFVWPIEETSPMRVSTPISPDLLD